MPNAPLPPIVSHTPLFDIAWSWSFIADRFHAKAEEIRNVYLLGKYLSYFYDWLANTYEGAAKVLFDADSYLRNIATWVDGLVNGTTFRDLLDYVSGEYKSLRQDPAGWVRNLVKAISYEVRKFVEDPRGYLDSYLKNLTWWYTTFLQEPGLWIQDRLDARFSWFRSFREDPYNTVKNWVLDRLPQLRALETSPQNWIVNSLKYWYGWIPSFFANPGQFVLDVLKGMNITIGQLLTNPLGFVVTQIVNSTGLNEWQLKNLPVVMFDKILANIESYVGMYLGRVEQAVCNIIMRFM